MTCGWKGDEVPVVRCKQCGGWKNYETGKRITCTCKRYSDEGSEKNVHQSSR